MGNVPKPRKEGQKGGGGRHGQAENRVRSGERGGNPYAGGAGQGKKAKAAGGGGGGGSNKKKSFWDDCLGVFLLFIVLPSLALVGGAGYVVYATVRAVL